MEIHERVLAGGQLKGSVERYAARNFANLGRVLAAAGQAREAEQSYRKAVNLLDRSVKELPESAYPRVDLARTLPRLADLLKDLGRWQEAEEIRRRVIHLYETLKANFAEDPEHRRNLARELPGAGLSALRARPADRSGRALSQGSRTGRGRPRR